jgi:lysophospholipase L1-like esterase
MLRIAAILTLISALALCVAFLARAAWIKEKVAALSEPASSAYAAANEALGAKGSRPRIVLIGDSRIARWPASGWPEQWEVINRGIGGETAAQLALRFRADALALDPDIIVIEAGVNDLVAGSFMDEAAGHTLADSTTEILQKLASNAGASGALALVATIVPAARPSLLRRLVWNESLRELVARVNDALTKSEWPVGAGVIDLAAPLITDNSQVISEEYRLDTLHINEAGYARLTSVLQAEIQSILDKR